MHLQRSDQGLGQYLTLRNIVSTVIPGDQMWTCTVLNTLLKSLNTHNNDPNKHSFSFLTWSCLELMKTWCEFTMAVSYWGTPNPSSDDIWLGKSVTNSMIKIYDLTVVTSFFEASEKRYHKYPSRIISYGIFLSCMSIYRRHDQCLPKNDDTSGS